MSECLTVGDEHPGVRGASEALFGQRHHRVMAGLGLEQLGDDVVVLQLRVEAYLGKCEGVGGVGGGGVDCGRWTVDVGR